ncbi:MAG: AbrB/MazE/SpoVT family DNA-binding domain-containing protein [Candidatus Woesearchaeota archaeon]
MISRKIQLIGNKSYSVSLPKDWVRQHNLKEKNILFIERTKNDDLIIKPIHTPKKNSFKFDIDKIENISEFVMFCYIKNINYFTLISKEFSYEQVSKIRKIITFLEGYEIVNETKTSIEIVFLFKEIDIKIKDIHRRIVFILKVMVDALEKKDYQTLEESEKNVDKLYHLSKRIIFSCYNNKQLREENDISGWEDLFFMKDISKKLEKIGDNLFEYKANITSSANQIIKVQLDVVNKIISKKDLNNLKLNLKNKYKNSVSEENVLINKVNERCLDILENALALEYNKKYFY